MQPVILNEKERAGMRAAGKFNAQLMDFLRPLVRSGVSTAELDEAAHEYTLQHGHKPACLGYKGYPKTICTSVNEVVCHGIPDGYRLRSGDIVNVDITTIVEGYYGDQSETFMIGEVSPAARDLVQTTFECLFLGIEAIKPFGKVIDIGRAIQRHAHARGFSVVREYQGHGIGRSFHLDPGIPHYACQSSAKHTILPGMCFTIEPMINLGTWETELDRGDGWTVRTLDRQLSAQFEHTILMTETGPEILTTTELGPRPGEQVKESP